MVLTKTSTRLLAAALALAVLGMAVAWSGIVSVGASTGHWAVTEWVLHSAMRWSVRTQAALTVEAPYSDPTGIVSAAGHFAGTCAVCHGAPGERPSPVMAASTPPAPDLALAVPEWSERQLFWIVKHGVKFTAMPAWPSLERDDEIRRMVAFLVRLPGMTPAEYRELAYGAGYVTGGQPARRDEALPDCTRCHGRDGQGRDQPDVPVLAGQTANYLLDSLQAYAAAGRDGGVMRAVAAKLDGDLMPALATYYSALPGLEDTRLAGTAGWFSVDETAARVVREGLPELDVPPCSECHFPGKHPRYPRLAGQKQDYLAGRLRRWRGDETIVDARKPDPPMPVIARRIPETLIEPLAAYFARQATPSPP